MNKQLLSVYPNGQPVENEKTIYTLENEAELERLANQYLDADREEEFSHEVVVSSRCDNEEPIREIYVARFNSHASWGLKGFIENGKNGKKPLFLEFCRDCE